MIWAYFAITLAASVFSGVTSHGQEQRTRTFDFEGDTERTPEHADPENSGAMRIRPITIDAEHEEALAEIDRLMDQNPAASTAAADRFGVLVTFVEAFENCR